MNTYDLTDGHDPMSHAEIDFLKELAASLPYQPLIVNIGAADGVSTCAFLEARSGATIYSVDVEECPQEYRNAARCGLDTLRIIRLLGRSEEIGVNFPYVVDLLFVDGGHFNAGNDIDAWLHCVKPGGIIAAHDYIEPPCPPENPGTVFDDVNTRMAGYPQIGDVVDRIIAFRV